MTRLLSQKFRFLTFACIFLLAYVHGYNLHDTYLRPYSTVNEPVTVTTFFEYLLANGLLRFRIPLLFLISGYLYAHYDDLPYGQRIRKRFTTLLVPYLLWSALALLLTFALQQHPYTAAVVKAAAVDQLGDNRPYTEIGWRGILWRWLLNPPAYQLWFIFVLFVYNLLYPLIRWVLLRAAWFWLPVCFLLWFTYFNMGFIEGQGLFFFSMGAFIRLRHYSIEKPPRWYSEGLAWIFFVGVCVIKTFMAFELPHHVPATWYTLSVLYNLAILAGIMAVWFSSSRLAAWCMRQPWCKTLSGYSFFMYGMHIPLLAYVATWLEQTAGHLAYFRLSSYLLLPAAMMLLCVGTARLLRRYLPTLYGWLAGGRGL